jgi:hypothetical protein
MAAPRRFGPGYNHCGGFCGDPLGSLLFPIGGFHNSRFLDDRLQGVSFRLHTNVAAMFEHLFRDVTGDVHDGLVASATLSQIGDKSVPVERRLFAALPPQSSPAIANSSAALRGSLWRVIRRSGIAAGLLICALALGYELGHRSAPNLASLKPASISPTPIPPGNTRSETKELPAAKNVESLENEIAAQQGQIHSLSSSISQLQEQRSLLVSKLTIQSQALDANAHDQNELKTQLAKAESDNHPPFRKHIFAELAIEHKLITARLRHLRRGSQLVEKQDALPFGGKKLWWHPFGLVRGNARQPA